MIRLSRVATVVALALAGAVLSGQAALAADEPKTPEQVADYFATGLVPRLADIYGPGRKADDPLAFGLTTKVGVVRRVLAWTPDFLGGKKTSIPTELTNYWVAPVSSKGDAVLGLATVWINPGTELPELADFDLGTGLAGALEKAPTGALLLHDTGRAAWLAVDGTKVTPLVAGTSGVTGPTTTAAYEKRVAAADANTSGAAPINQGLLIAGIVLGVVVVLLVVFVLLPDRKRRSARNADAVEGTDVAGAPHPVAEPEPVVEPDLELVAAPAAAPAAAKSPAVKQAAPRPPATKPAAKTTPPETTPPETTPAKTTPAKPAAAKPAAAKPTSPKPAAATPRAPRKTQPVKPAAPATTEPPAPAE